MGHYYVDWLESKKKQKKNIQNVAKLSIQSVSIPRKIMYLHYISFTTENPFTINHLLVLTISLAGGGDISVSPLLLQYRLSIHQQFPIIFGIPLTCIMNRMSSGMDPCCTNSFKGNLVARVTACLFPN